MSPSHATLENWPWTIAIDGNRIWFDTEDQARFRVWKEFKNGSLTFAIGCFQLDYRQHGQAFASIEAMFDPFENAHVAAIALAQLKSHLGDWPSAIAAFRLHNRVHFPHAPVTLRIARSGDGRHHKVILDRLPQVGSKEPTQTDSRLSQRKTLTKDSLGTSNGS